MVRGCDKVDWISVLISLGGLKVGSQTIVSPVRSWTNIETSLSSAVGAKLEQPDSTKIPTVTTKRGFVFRAVIRSLGYCLYVRSNIYPMGVYINSIHLP